MNQDKLQTGFPLTSALLIAFEGIDNDPNALHPYGERARDIERGVYDVAHSVECGARLYDVAPRVGRIVTSAEICAL